MAMTDAMTDASVPDDNSESDGAQRRAEQRAYAAMVKWIKDNHSSLDAEIILNGPAGECVGLRRRS